MNVVLVSLFNVRSFSVRILEACLAGAGIDTTSVYFKDATLKGMARFSEDEISTLGEIILSSSPDLIGISLKSTFHNHASRLTSYLKERSRAPVAWGGTHAIVMPELCLEHADIVCVGEGEKTIVEMAERIGDGKSLEGVENIHFKRGGEVVRNSLGPLTENLDELPLPIIGSQEGSRKIYFDGAKVFYDDPMIALNSTFYDFLSARGCPFSCTYCTNSFLRTYFRGKGRYIRQRSVDHTIAELRLARERLPHLNRIGANDEIFGLDEEWVEAFCEKYREHIGLPFHCDMHPAYIREGIVEKLATIDLESVTIGVQNALARVRVERYRRNTPEKMLREGVELLHRHGVKVHYDFIFDDPLADYEEYAECLDWLLVRPRPFYVAMYSMQHHPKTPYTERLLEEGIITEAEVDGLSEKGLSEWRVTSGLQKREERLELLLRVIDLFNGPIVTRSGKKRYYTLVPTWLIRLLGKMAQKPALNRITRALLDLLHFGTKKVPAAVYETMKRIKSRISLPLGKA